MSLAAHIAEQGHWADELTRRQAESDEVVFAFRGELHPTDLEQLLGAAEAHSIAAMAGVSARKRLFNVLVEGLENIRTHTEPELAGTSFALLVYNARGYRVLFGNAAPQVTVALLTSRVDILNEMDEADLREYHLKVLANEGRTERGGAGLGLLTMARKSSGLIRTHCIPRDQNTAFVVLELDLLAA